MCKWHIELHRVQGYARSRNMDSFFGGASSRPTLNSVIVVRWFIAFEPQDNCFHQNKYQIRVQRYRLHHIWSYMIKWPHQMTSSEVIWGHCEWLTYLGWPFVTLFVFGQVKAILKCFSPFCQIFSRSTQGPGIRLVFVAGAPQDFFLRARPAMRLVGFMRLPDSVKAVIAWWVVGCISMLIKIRWARHLQNG